MPDNKQDFVNFKAGSFGENLPNVMTLRGVVIPIEWIASDNIEYDFPIKEKPEYTLKEYAYEKGLSPKEAESAYQEYLDNLSVKYEKRPMQVFVPIVAPEYATQEVIGRALQEAYGAGGLGVLQQAGIGLQSVIDASFYGSTIRGMEREGFTQGEILADPALQDFTESWFNDIRLGKPNVEQKASQLKTLQSIKPMLDTSRFAPGDDAKAGMLQDSANWLKKQLTTPGVERNKIDSALLAHSVLLADTNPGEAINWAASLPQEYQAQALSNVLGRSKLSWQGGAFQPENVNQFLYANGQLNPDNVKQLTDAIAQANDAANNAPSQLSGVRQSAFNQSLAQTFGGQVDQSRLLGGTGDNPNYGAYKGEYRGAGNPSALNPEARALLGTMDENGELILTGRNEFQRAKTPKWKSSNFGMAEAERERRKQEKAEWESLAQKYNPRQPKVSI